MLGTDYRAKAPPRATPATAITAGRIGNCSIRRGAALDLLDVGEALVPAAVPVPEAAEDEAGSHSKSME